MKKEKKSVIKIRKDDIKNKLVSKDVWSSDIMITINSYVMS